MALEDSAMWERNTTSMAAIRGAYMKGHGYSSSRKRAIRAKSKTVNLCAIEFSYTPPGLRFGTHLANLPPSLPIQRTGVVARIFHRPRTPQGVFLCWLLCGGCAWEASACRVSMTGLPPRAQSPPYLCGSKSGGTQIHREFQYD